MSPLVNALIDAWPYLIAFTVGALLPLLTILLLPMSIRIPVTFVAVLIALAATGWIAARIGKSKEYVYQRLKYTALIPEVKAAFMDGKFLTGGHAVLIARLQAKDQATALTFCTLVPGTATPAVLVP